MKDQDIRWIQRFSNYKKALAKLGEVVVSTQSVSLSELEKEGLIHRFEYTYELAWKTLQDLLRTRGYIDIAGPNPVLEQSFHEDYIADVAGWKSIMKSRALTSHAYHNEIADCIAGNVIKGYYLLFMNLSIRLQELENV